MNLPEYFSQHRTRERGHGDGTVKKEGNKWVGYYHVYVGDKRKAREKVLGLCAEMTKVQAKDALRELSRKANDVPQADSSDATFGAVAEDYFGMKLGDWSPGEVVTKRAMYNRVLIPALGDRPIKAITAEELKRFVNSLPNRTWYSVRSFKEDGEMKREDGKAHKGISESYARKIINTVSAICKLAVVKGLIPFNPADHPAIQLTVPKQAKPPDKRTLPPEELTPLLAALDWRDSLIVWIAMLGALRPGELFALFVRNVGVDRLYIENALDRHRKFDETKTRKPRQVFLPPMLRSDLGDWINRHQLQPNDLLFRNSRNKPLNKDNFIDRNLRRAAERARITMLDVDFQMLRRSFTTAFIALGGDVKSAQGQLGHARPDMTLTEYAQVVDPHRAAMLERAELIFRGKLPWPDEATSTLRSKQGAATLVQ